jgi:hypothetical protein
MSDAACWYGGAIGLALIALVIVWDALRKDDDR